MEITLAAQTVVFLRAVLLGVLCGALYDICRAMRRATYAGALLTAVLDGLFWLGALALMFLFSVIYAPGQARGYVLVGEGMGLALYLLSFSPLLLPLLTALLRMAALAAAIPVRALRRCGGFYTLRKKSIKILKKMLPFLRGSG